MKNLALFDFDGTITTKDTFLEFIKFTHGPLYFYAGFLLLSPFLVLMKLKLYPNWKAKEQVIGFFYKGKRITALEEKALEFTEQQINSLIRPKALTCLQNHLKNGDDVFIVSASASLWVKPFAQNVGVPLLATELAQKEGKLTGKLKGNNCYGPEKVNRIKDAVKQLEHYQRIYAYGDSSGDKEMLALSDRPYMRYFE